MFLTYFAIPLGKRPERRRCSSALNAFAKRSNVLLLAKQNTQSGRRAKHRKTVYFKAAAGRAFTECRHPAHDTPATAAVYLKQW